MADGADLIDIYAEEEFMQVGETRAGAKRHESEFAAEQLDLYDDVLAVASLGPVHNDGKTNEPTSPVQATLAESNKKTPAMLYTYNNVRVKASVYIGNFTWWTTDQQLLSAIRSVGVHDPVELKFAENRANGKSKGYAEVVLSSEASLSHILEQLPSKKVNGKKLDVRPANRQSLSFFEAIARKTEGVPNSKDSVDPADGFFSPTDPAVSLPRLETPKNVVQYFARPPFMDNNSRIPVMTLPRPPMSVPPPPSSALPAVYRAPPIPPMHYSHLMPPPPRLPPPLMPPPGGVPPALHLNPAFFPPPNSMVCPPPDPYKMISNPYLQGRDMKLQQPLVSEAEFEELMNRNRAISRSALSNAVCGATSGDYANSIKTLETAIAVIKESRVANDDRCRVLLTSLRDCLHGIQDKANSSRKRHRSRERSPSRSREGSSRRHRDPHEDRSDDYYHDRHRDKDRHR
ncbi:cleavage and polyadenylation specificity factor subunit 7 isoform X1 [Bufo gargarizans]|uniref:cleavage and polyadenylation specificity factor subunit 7 isoform X1 n=1 Tax=Bufo gargarizans TaxID=30331 RepID=UPI001CF2BD37|nr:cleavage and polyadenylation specificity factor subunit 7 isoform X1 [Bufo gargarizans]